MLIHRTDKPVVVTHVHDFVPSLTDPITDTVKEVRRMYVQTLLDRKELLRIPHAAYGDTSLICSIERIEDTADYPDIFCKSAFIGGIDAITVTGVYMKSERQENFR